MKFDRITFEGKYVRLEPLSESHRGALIEAKDDSSDWLYITPALNAGGQIAISYCFN